MVDDLDREIEEAARSARRTVRQGRLAMAAALATFFAVAAATATVAFSLFPETGERELERRERERKASGQSLDLVGVAENYQSWKHDANRGHWQILFALVSSFGAAIYVLNRLEPKDDSK